MSRTASVNLSHNAGSSPVDGPVLTNLMFLTMGIKSLFFNSEENEENDSAKVEPKKTRVTDTEEVSFPKSSEEKETAFPTPKRTTNFTDDESDMFSAKAKPSPETVEVTSKDDSNPYMKNPYMEEITKFYEDGFNKLNKEGVDFYEFYQSIKVGGVDNTAAYPMAFNMCRGMNPELSKESMISDGEDYITSIEGAYNQYKSSGESKLSQTNDEKSSEEASLRTEVGELEEQVRQLTATLNSKKRDLSSIGDKYKDKIEGISLKLEANKVAKSNIINNITKVITNIKNNL